MSWLRQYASRDAFNEGRTNYPDQYETQGSDRVKAQIATARRAAIQLMDSDAVGDGEFNISISGHAADEPAPGDSITVSVSSK